ncbi:CRISPR-associated endoribonuclease Cas6 [Desulfocicer niacini]
MYRIRITLPKGKMVTYRNLDLLHDALIHAWIKAGASSDAIWGSNAAIWHFGVLGWHYKGENRAHSLVVGTPDDCLSECLSNMDTKAIQYTRALTGEHVDFSEADIIEDLDPVGPNQNSLGLVLLSPLAISRTKKEKKGPRWHTSLKEIDLSQAVNHRLSRLTGQKVSLTVSPDNLYLRSHSKHHTLVQIKKLKNGHKVFVIGMRAPLVMTGNEKDLRLAWYSGIGEKNRMGFGCVGLAERGIGR